MCFSTKIDKKFKINFLKGVAKEVVTDDYCDGGGSGCDPYIKLSIDGKQVFRTKEYSDNSEPQFNEVYTSEAPISKQSGIVIEMYDADAAPEENLDELMGKWSLKLSDIDGKQKTYTGGYSNKNSLTFVAEWLPSGKNVNIQLY